MFDLSCVKFSENDRRNSIKIPTQMCEKLAEEIGMHIGDGSMNIYSGKCLFSLRGHKTDDCEYYNNHVVSIYRDLYNINVKIRKWPDVVGFQKSSTSLITFKHEIIGLPLGNKGDLTIPEIMINDKKFAASCLRGIFDTDGCVYLEPKPSGLYPRIEISSTSKLLIDQIKYLLDNILKIDSSVWISRKENGKWKNVNRISVRGRKNAYEWIKLIGSSNPKHKRKLNKIISAPRRI